MKNYLLITIFALFAFSSIAQNIEIDGSTPFAAAKNTSIDVNFNPPQGQPGPYTVELVALEIYGSIFGGTPFIQTVIKSNTTTSTNTANISIGNILPNGRYFNGDGINFVNINYYLRAYTGTPDPISPQQPTLSYYIAIKATPEPILGLRHSNTSTYPSGVVVPLRMVNGIINPDNNFEASLIRKFGYEFNEEEFIADLPVDYQPGGRVGLQINAINTLTVTLPLGLADTDATEYFIRIQTTSPNDLDEVGLFIDNSIPLPVTLINFTANSTAQGNLLQWQTSSEKNFSHFEIERSLDAQKFQEIGIVKGGNFEKYEYLDTENLIQKNSTLNYYRLKQVDLDGKYEYSKIISVKNESNQNLLVYPNPVRDYLIVKNENANSLDMSLLNSSGQSFIQLKNVNKPEIKFDLTNVPKGMYFLQIVDKNDVKYEKIIKD